MPDDVEYPQAAPALERHYTPQEIAEKWNLSLNAIRDMFRHEPGVMKFGNPVSRPGKKRAYATIRVPESVMHRVHARMSVQRPS
jgi:hypothetical protein